MALMRSCQRVGMALCVALSTLAAPAVVEAQDARVLSGDAEAQARREYEAGRRLYEAGQYREAIERFAAGYALAPRPIFLLNIGQAHRQLFEPARARESYAAFLAQAPADDPARPEVEELVREIDASLSARAAPAIVATAPPPRSFARRHWWIFPVSAVVAAGAAVGIYFAIRPPGRLGCSDAKFGCLDAMQ
jgi:tetratricopeptide (TPR) repeat protein